MKSTRIPQLAAMLAALAFTLPACVQDTDGDEGSTESVGSAEAELEQGPGKQGRHEGHQGKLEFMKKRFAEADGNSDGQVTRQEQQAALAARFAKVDADQDGELSPEELEAMKEARHGKATRKGKRADQGKRADKGEREGKRMRGPKRMDLDDSGSVSLDEFSQHGLRWFDKADADGNDAVTLEELQSAAKAMRGKMGRHGKGKHGRKGMRHLQQADANDDGQITKAEAQAHRSAKFDELDQNGDGVLSAEERPAKHKRGHKARGGDERGGKGKGFSRMDANEDGQLTKAEFVAGADRMFERLDANGDDVISTEELESRAARHRKGRNAPVQ